MDVLFNVTLLSTLASIKPIEYCPQGWHYYDQRQRCFSLNYEPMPWNEARTTCKAYGGDLTTIPDSETNAFVKGLIQPSCAQYWIGLNDKSSEGVFKWLNEDGETKFTYWAPNEPNNFGDEDCVFISARKESHWNDAVCSAYLSFSCELAAKDRNAGTTPEAERPVSPTSRLGEDADPTPAPVEPCPVGWSYYATRQRCFYASLGFERRDQVKEWCKEVNGGDLATIPDLQTNEFIKGLLPGDQQMNAGWWIGLNDIQKENSFRWLEDDAEAKFTNWALTNPHTSANNTVDCVSILSDGLWLNLRCHNLAGELCERDAAVNAHTDRTSLGR